MYDEWLTDAATDGDQDTPDKCDRWADECFTIYQSYPDFHNAQVFNDLANDFRILAEELRAGSYGA